MSYVDLIQQRLQALSPAQQAEVFDFVEFLASRRAAAAGPADTSTAPTLAHSPIAAWLDKPIEVVGFTPLSREEANARD